MKHTNNLPASLVLVVGLACGLAAQAVEAPRPIYGSQLMTQAERNTHRATLRKIKTEQEREAFRLEHHKLMQERASAKGITLPAEPVAGGVGPGAGMGGGAGGPGPKK